MKKISVYVIVDKVHFGPSAIMSFLHRFGIFDPDVARRVRRCTFPRS